MSGLVGDAGRWGSEDEQGDVATQDEDIETDDLSVSSQESELKPRARKRASVESGVFPESGSETDEAGEGDESDENEDEAGEADESDDETSKHAEEEEIPEGQSDEAEDTRATTQKESQKKDPAYVPTQGAFFLHDNRLEEQVATARMSGRRQRRHASEDAEVWLHDKYEEIVKADARDIGVKNPPDEPSSRQSADTKVSKRLLRRDQNAGSQGVTRRKEHKKQVAPRKEQNRVSRSHESGEEKQIENRQNVSRKAHQTCPKDMSRRGERSKLARGTPRKEEKVAPQGPSRKDYKTNRARRKTPKAIPKLDPTAAAFMPALDVALRQLQAPNDDLENRPKKSYSAMRASINPLKSHPTATDGNSPRRGS